jgi:hypothetical protein
MGWFCKAPLSINLSNQFYEDLRQLYDLEPFVKATSFEPKRGSFACVGKTSIIIEQVQCLKLARH